MSVFELAKQYYPRLWDKARIDALVGAGKLTEAEAEEIIQEQDEPIINSGTDAEE